MIFFLQNKIIIYVALLKSSKIKTIDSSFFFSYLFALFPFFIFYVIIFSFAPPWNPNFATFFNGEMFDDIMVD